MLVYILGEKTFDKGITVNLWFLELTNDLILFKITILKKYLDKFKYQNVDQFDLWDILNQVMSDFYSIVYLTISRDD